MKPTLDTVGRIALKIPFSTEESIGTFTNRAVKENTRSCRIETSAHFDTGSLAGTGTVPVTIIFRKDRPLHAFSVRFPGYGSWATYHGHRAAYEEALAEVVADVMEVMV